MKSKPVVLLFKDFDKDGVNSYLRRLCRNVLMPFVTKLREQWKKEAESVLGDWHAPLTEALDTLTRVILEDFCVLSSGGTIACEPFFGYYDAPRDAVIFGLRHTKPQDDTPYVALEDLFEGIDNPHLYFFLAFKLEDIRVGNIVLAYEIDSHAPEHLNAGLRDEIFEAAGIPKPE